MYFLRYQPLKEKLKTRSLSDREGLPYLIVISVLTALVFLLPTTGEFNGWDWLRGILSVVLAAGGVTYAYVKNGGADGFDLIQKFVVIGWVVTVRWLLFLIPPAIVLFIADEALGLMTEETGWVDVLILGGVEAVLCQRIGRHVADTR